MHLLLIKLNDDMFAWPGAVQLSSIQWQSPISMLCADASLPPNCAVMPGLWPYRALWVYGGLAMGTFIVRTMKHVLFHDSHHFSELFGTVLLNPQASFFTLLKKLSVCKLSLPVGSIGWPSLRTVLQPGLIRLLLIIIAYSAIQISKEMAVKLIGDCYYAGGRVKLNYLLLGLALFQFPFLAWLHVKP